MNEAALEHRLLAAHARNDLEALTALYEEAANQRQERGDEEAACFYLTHAFVYALETGSPRADALQLRLWKLGREQKPHSHLAQDHSGPSF